MHPSENQPGSRPASTARSATPAGGAAERPDAPIAAVRGVVGAIPARWGSSRLPGKPLLPIGGRPMIEHVVRRAERAPALAAVVVLTDDERIAEAVAAFGGRWQMTPADCASGTDRIAWAARGWAASAVVNVQGDEPLIDPAVVDAVARHLVAHPGDPVVTCAAPALAEEADDPNAVKVVVDAAGYALYFSRAAIPYRRRGGAAAHRKHLGIYGYQRRALLELARLPPAPLERLESLEQLRALHHGIRIRVLDADRAAPGVDTEEDLKRVEAMLEESD